jgi:hypothetical protein
MVVDRGEDGCSASEYLHTLACNAGRVRSVLQVMADD